MVCFYHSYATDKNIFITGNGPSAIVLSYILAGHIPYWNGCPVSNDYLNIKLEQYVKDTSLLEQVIILFSQEVYK